ncbi:MAG: bifunctional folylpolyglutamate synthase/dihydrofolate synthase [Oscillatoriales cyanobacterium SM2_2_1]|nr:bifunctional folylpolyglutamate synthase/dihydrofolate synthase [Oscillatoriales cyanobacterium SM2_2_1]
MNLRLEDFARFGIHLGLEQIKFLLDQLGNPHHRVPIIHVAGTNGKGSVCAFLRSVLTLCGYRTGCYTSPHLVSWRERITIDGQWISEADLTTGLAEVTAKIDPQSPPTQFEVITAIAWWHFARQQVDIAVIETGLGGRLDATNVCDSPLATIITSISRDHWQRLGDSLGAIAREKAGIIKPGSPLIVGPLPPEADSVIQERAAALGAPLYRAKPDPPLTLSLQGQHQQINGAIARCALEKLTAKGWRISTTQIMAGLRQARWPGRLQFITYQQRPLLLDGAHNVAAAMALREFVEPTPSPHHWIIGILSTKDAIGILHALLKPGDYLYAVPIPDHATTDPQYLVAHAPPKVHAHPYPSLLSALAALPQETPSPPILCGSLYLIGDALNTLIPNESSQ